jgi:hypothetical protein
MSKRINLIIPDALYEQLQDLVKAQPRSVQRTENVTLPAVAREALRRGAESLEKEIKRK